MDDNTPHDLTKLVLDKLAALETVPAAVEYFGVAAPTISLWKSGKGLPTLKAAQKVWEDTLLCQAPELWGKESRAQIQLLMPMMDWIEPMTFITLVRACKLYGFDKISIIPKDRTLIIEARNDLAARALLTTSEWFIFADADGIFPCGSGAILRKLGHNVPEPKASRNAIERLMSHPADKLIVGALYRDRRGGTRAQCEIAFRSPQENARLLGFFDGKTQGDGLEETGWVGFSLVRINRSVFERMKEAAKPGGPLSDIAPVREGQPHGFFDTTRQARGEDVKFCRRAEQIGVKVFVDNGLLCGHMGKKCY